LDVFRTLKSALTLATLVEDLPIKLF